MQSSLPYGLAPHAELHSEEHWRWLMHIPRKEPTSTKLAPTIPISASLRYLSARVQGAETIGICRVDGNKVNSGNAQRFRYCSTHHSLVLPYPHNVLRGSQRAWFCACLGTSARTISTYSLAHELSSDPTSRSHLAALYDALLQKNLLRTVEPYSVIEIDYVARPSAYYIFSVKNDLGQGVHGVLDQERGCPIVFDELEADVQQSGLWNSKVVIEDQWQNGTLDNRIYFIKARVMTHSVSSETQPCLENSDVMRLREEMVME
ncbi:hypothetical protein F4604DRAFT_1686115 [Suillus subluteus]|nr:hypothetical protein F4604DRAFT_1686115 [Suillus subluteus]